MQFLGLHYSLFFVYVWAMIVVTIGKYSNLSSDNHKKLKRVLSISLLRCYAKLQFYKSILHLFPHNMFWPVHGGFDKTDNYNCCVQLDFGRWKPFWISSSLPNFLCRKIGTVCFQLPFKIYVCYKCSWNYLSRSKNIPASQVPWLTWKVGWGTWRIHSSRLRKTSSRPPHVILSMYICPILWIIYVHKETKFSSQEHIHVLAWESLQSPFHS